jgi:hypothetical protein
LSRTPLLLTLVGVITLLAACGSGASSEPDRSSPKFSEPPAKPVETANPAVTFAPLVYLHSAEENFPIGAEELIDSSTLYWAGGERCTYDLVAIGRIARSKTKAPVPTLEPRHLGGPPFRHAPVDADCSERSGARRYATTDYTRPYDVDRRAGTPPIEQGFALNLLTSRYPGRRPGRSGEQATIERVPAYFERAPELVDDDPGLRITYWLLFGSTEQRRFGPKWETFPHEGGWERIGVLLRRRGARSWAPASVRYYGYGGDRDTAPEGVEWASTSSEPATHPVVYLALGSHSTYPDAARHERFIQHDDGPRYGLMDVTEAPCRDCARWRTWDVLRDARRQPWYGFGGAWGVAFSSHAQTGPLGPSRFAPVTSRVAAAVSGGRTDD